MKTFGTSSGDTVTSASKFFAMLLIGIFSFAMILHLMFVIELPKFEPVPLQYDNIYINYSNVA